MQPIPTHKDLCSHIFIFKLNTTKHGRRPAERSTPSRQRFPPARSKSEDFRAPSPNTLPIAPTPSISVNAYRISTWGYNDQKWRECSREIFDTYACFYHSRPMYDTCHVSDNFFFKLCHTSTHSKLIFHTALPFSPDNFLKNSKNFHSGEILHFYFSSYSSISFMNFTKLCQFMKDIMVPVDFAFQLYTTKSTTRDFHLFKKFS